MGVRGEMGSSCLSVKGEKDMVVLKILLICGLKKEGFRSQKVFNLRMYFL